MLRKSLLLLLLVLPLSGYARESKSYSYPGIRTRVWLQANGDAHIVQERTYAFNGDFSWAFVNLKKQGAAGIAFRQLAELTSRGLVPLQPELSETREALNVRWTYSARNEQRTFVLDYTVKGAVQRYRDVAEFYWKLIEDEHRPVRQATAEVYLPESSPELLKAYIHCAAPPGQLVIDTNRTQVTVRQSGIPENTFQEIRLLMVPFIFTGVPAQAESHLQRTLDQEKANYTASRLRILVLIPLGLLLVLVLPLLLLVVFYVRYGREPQLDYAAIYEREPPRPAPPLVVPAILHQKPSADAMAGEFFRAMFATLLDLCRKGIVSVQEIKAGHKSKYQFRLEKPEAAGTLDPYSRQALDYFFTEVADTPGVLTESAIAKYNRANREHVRKMLSGMLVQAVAWWQQALGVDFTSRTSHTARVRFMGIAVLGVLAGAALIGWGAGTILGTNHQPWVLAGIVATAFGAVYLLSSSIILRWNDAAYLEHKRWWNFRKFLRDFSALEQAPVALLPLWERYYVYATVLGVAEHFLKHVTRLAEQRGTPLPLPVWYIAAAGAHPGAGLADLQSGLAGFQSFATNFTGMMNSFSSATATGGGFSGGGGGGGGGGSSGAG
jgi:hypothetical protein